MERQIAALGSGLVCVREMSQRHWEGVCVCGAVTIECGATCARQQARILEKKRVGECIQQGADDYLQQGNSLHHHTKWATHGWKTMGKPIYIESQTNSRHWTIPRQYNCTFFIFKRLQIGCWQVRKRARTHSVVVKTRSQTVLVKQSFFLFFLFNPHPFPFNAWPSVSASWASPERCNKAGDGWGLPQQLYTIKLSHWALPDPSHMIRSIKHGHNSHLSSGDNDGVKLA